MTISEISKKWNERYLEEPGKYNAPVRNILKKYSDRLPRQGLALDIAGGVGVSADYLQRKGLQVLELDVSFQALRLARRKNAQVFQVAADANQLPFDNSKFDIICNFYYFERKLIPLLISRLKPGGLIFFETLTIEMLSLRPEIPSDYLLQLGELKAAFASLEIIYYFEGWINSDHGKRKSIGSLVARNPEISV
ncbi:MAG: class I SAM-dependent methyltransferase [Leptolinea sp.]